MSISKPPADTDSTAVVPAVPVRVTVLLILNVPIEPVALTPVISSWIFTVTVFTAPVEDTLLRTSVGFSSTVFTLPVADTPVSVLDMSSTP